MRLKSFATGVAHFVLRHSLWCHGKAGMAGGVATEHAHYKAQRVYDKISAHAIEHAATATKR